MNFAQALVENANRLGRPDVAALANFPRLMRRVERRVLRQMKDEGVDVSKIDWAAVDWAKVLQMVLMILAALGVL